MVDRSRQLAFARRLRREPPATERLLWKLLRNRRLDGLKFRRQLPLGRYVADFVCLRHRLIVEADGPHHTDSTTDAVRDAWLRSQGFRVLRFLNAEIQGHPDRVLGVILEACAAPPSPLAGEGFGEADG
jgi:very-short-patch-repair endonuclease